MKILPQARNLCIGIALFLGITFDAEAQITQDYLQQFIEFITENQDGGEEFDYSEIGEQLDDWSRSPIDINSPEAAILVQWKIISDNAYRNLQDHLYQTGPLLDLLELQSISGFDPEMIRILKVIATVKGRETQTQSIPFGQMLIHGQNEIYLRAGRTIQEADGYLGEDLRMKGVRTNSTCVTGTATLIP